MFLNTPFVKKNNTNIAIVLFLLLFGLLAYWKPSSFFKKDGSLREFGIGYKKKTIFPLWLCAIFLAILCYISVKYVSILHY